MPKRSFHSSRSTTAVAVLAMLVTMPARAGTIHVTVLDPDGNPVPDVAVYVTREQSASRAAPGTAVMDQRDTRFVPHILVVQKGTSVEFPNSDIVAHHVYSFSKPNNFVLPLYKGDPHNPVRFDHDGIVTLGCNIHDHMLGYIVVVDSDVFGVTDGSGQLSMEVSDTTSDIAVNIWSPRLRDKELTQVVRGGASSLVFALQKKLRPPHDPGTGAVQWSEY